MALRTTSAAPSARGIELFSRAAVLEDLKSRRSQLELELVAARERAQVSSKEFAAAKAKAARDAAIVIELEDSINRLLSAANNQLRNGLTDAERAAIDDWTVDLMAELVDRYPWGQMSARQVEAVNNRLKDLRALDQRRRDLETDLDPIATIKALRRQYGIQSRPVPSSRQIDEEGW